MKKILKLATIFLAVGAMTVPVERIEAEDKAVGEKKIVFVAGRQSHGYGAHEHNAGCMLLAKWLDESGLPVKTVVHKDGWPEDFSIFEGADAIVVYADGGGNHPVRPHMEKVNELIEKGIGFAAIHYACEIPKGKEGDFLKQWIGGYFETHWSVNPHWIAKFDELPDHPIARGVRPFEINDEWYYNMRFVDGMKGIVPILTDIPPESTLERPDGPHSGNPHVRAMKGEPQHVAWGYERPDGGRGFGFTGGHWHWNWAHPDFRTVMLNAIVWVADMEVPEGGVPSKTPTMEDMEANQDYPKRDDFDSKRIESQIEEWNK